MTDFLWIRVKNYTEPLGFDIENTFLLKMKMLDPRATTYVPPESVTGTSAEQLMTLADRIRLYPDVEALSISFYAAPYRRGGWWNELRGDTAVTGEIMQGRSVTPEYFDVLRIRTPQGQPLRMAYGDELHPAVVTEDVAANLFGSVENAVGQYVYNNDPTLPMRIVAVCSRFKNQEFEPYRPSFFDVMSPVRLAEAIERMSLPVTDLLVRVRPGSERHFRDNFETDMGERLRVDNLYVSSVVPASQLRDDVVGRSLRGEIRQMGYVSLFVLITVCLGVFGTFWLRTFQRRGETGIRMSMGASPQTIRRNMMTEGFCLMLIALPPALFAYFNMLSAEVLDVWRLPVNGTRIGIATAASIVIMSCVIAFGIRLPATRASKLQPAEALQYE
jgi:hypothetical protein